MSAASAEAMPVPRWVVVVAAILVAELLALAMVATHVPSLGYDLPAYVNAAQRTLDGASLYDPSVTAAGAFAVYLYPPPFALAAIPFAILPDWLALWQWEALLIGAFLAGVAILPVRPNVRLGILALSVLDWPVIYSLLLGQVAPFLFLIFAIGWRWRDRPAPLGLALAAGIVIKIQPIIVLAWAGATGRWRAVAIAVVALAVAGLAATVVFGVGIWSDYASLLTKISAAVTTAHNFTPGGIAFVAGASRQVADAIQVVTFVAVLAFVAFATVRASAEVSYLAAVVATQVLSPIIWDHYAVILLLPTAWLLARRQWWAVAIPLLTSMPLIVVMPVVIYPILFGVGLVAPTAVELAGRRHAPRTEASMPAVTS